MTPGVVTAGHNVPPAAAGREAGLPELSEERVNEAPLPAVDGAANGSAIAPTRRKDGNNDNRDNTRYTVLSGFQVLYG